MPANSSKQTILIIDDSLLNIKMLERILGPEYKTKSAQDGTQALALAGPEADARASLVRGVFLLAEGDLPAARKALGAAGDVPHAAIYKARLEAQAGGH